jgi:hypothetical protein
VFTASTSWSEAALRRGLTTPQMLNTNSETRIGPATVIVVVQLPFSSAIWLEKAYLVRMKTISPARDRPR